MGWFGKRQLKVNNLDKASPGKQAVKNNNYLHH